MGTCQALWVWHKENKIGWVWATCHVFITNPMFEHNNLVKFITNWYSIFNPTAFYYHKHKSTTFHIPNVSSSFFIISIKYSYLFKEQPSIIKMVFYEDAI